MIDPTDKERVRQATDFAALVGETVLLKPRGHELWGCCPFHEEKSPSFKINPSTGLWHCFGCGQGGDVFDYISRRENLDFVDSIRYLADRAGIELTEQKSHASRGPRRSRLIACLTQAETFYHTQLMRSRGMLFSHAREYFANRGFKSDVCKKWKLGVAPGREALVQHLQQQGFTKAEMIAANLAVERRGFLQDVFYDRVMFPIHDETGRCIGFGGRVMGDAKPKYLNTKETPVFHKGKHLFAFDYAKASIAQTGVVIVCEGYTDVIAMHEAGFTNTVAALGTSFSLDHVKTISRFAQTIICMFDGDAAGQKAAQRAVQFIDKTSADMRCVVLPDNLDPAEFLAARGAQALQQQLDASRPLIDFVFSKMLASYDLTVVGQRLTALDDIASVLAPLKQSLIIDEYAMRLSDALGTDLNETKRRIQRATPKTYDTRDSWDRQAATGAYDDKGSQTRIPSSAAADPAATQAPPATSATASPAMQALSLEERRQLACECELLSFMAEHIDAARPFDTIIGGFDWVDSRHQILAWAMLATPYGTPADQVVLSAQAAFPEASKILSSGKLSHVWTGPEDKKLEFLIKQLDLFSTKRRVRKIRAQLHASLESAQAEELLKQATALQLQVQELSKNLSSLLSPDNNG